MKMLVCHGRHVPRLGRPRSSRFSPIPHRARCRAGWITDPVTCDVLDATQPDRRTGRRRGWQRSRGPGSATATLPTSRRTCATGSRKADGRNRGRRANRARRERSRHCLSLSVVVRGVIPTCAANQRSVTLDGLQTNRARHDQPDRHDPGRVSGFVRRDHPDDRRACGTDPGPDRVRGPGRGHDPPHTALQNELLARLGEAVLP
jgi:hypothetical protein